MTHTPKWIIESAVKGGDRAVPEIIKHFVLDGYSVKTAKRHIRDMEAVGLLTIEDGEIRPHWGFSKSTIAVPSLSS